MGLRQLLQRVFGRAPLDGCPVCGGVAQEHPLRTLCRERFTAGQSGIEALLAQGRYAQAAALDEPGTLGDALVHELMLCGSTVVLVTTAEPAAPDLDAQVRRTSLLTGEAAQTAWSHAS